MGFLFFIKEYATWHYGRSLGELFGVWKNLVWFNYHYFSLGLMLRTFFQSFRRFHVAYDIRGLKLEELAGNFALNSIMRLVGMLFRSIVLAIGVLVEFFLIASLPALFLVWLLAPVLITSLILAALIFLIP